jgi:hypothetical protein
MVPLDLLNGPIRCGRLVHLGKNWPPFSAQIGQKFAVSGPGQPDLLRFPFFIEARPPLFTQLVRKFWGKFLYPLRRTQFYTFSSTWSVFEASAGKSPELFQETDYLRT